MKQELQEYNDALEAYVAAQRNKTAAELEVISARKRLMMAREELRAREYDLLHADEIVK